MEQLSASAQSSNMEKITDSATDLETFKWLALAVAAIVWEFRHFDSERSHVENFFANKCMGLIVLNGYNTNYSSMLIKE